MNGKAWSPQEVEFLKTAKTPEDHHQNRGGTGQPRVSVRKKAWQLGMEGVARTFAIGPQRMHCLGHYPKGASVCC